MVPWDADAGLAGPALAGPALAGPAAWLVPPLLHAATRPAAAAGARPAMTARDASRLGPLRDEPRARGPRISALNLLRIVMLLLLAIHSLAVNTPPGLAAFIRPANFSAVGQGISGFQ